MSAAEHKSLDRGAVSTRQPLRYFSYLHLCLWGFFGLVLHPAAAHAQLPQVRLDRIFPLGGAAGSSVVIDIAGKDLDEVKTLRFDHPGFKAEPVKENQFRITIAADTPAGTYDLRAVGKYGISGSRLFVVSRGLQEVQQADGNDDPSKPQAVPMNAVVNGVSRANAAEYYRFHAGKGQRVTIDCRAFRLDSTLHPSLSLSAADGRELAEGKPHFGPADVLIDFTAPADGDYVLKLNDLTYLGDLPYRLVVSTRPRLDAVFPPAVRAGTFGELTLLGANLPGGKPAGNLQELRLPFTMPREAACPGLFEFVHHVAAPAFNARAFQFVPMVCADAINPITVARVGSPVVCEREPNDVADKAQAVELPAVLCGRFDRPGDVDWYTFKAKAGDVIAVDLLCERLGLPGDAVVILSNAKGEDLTTFDDHGNNADALTQMNADPVGTFAIPEDGTYRLQVRERCNRGGSRYLYAMRVGKAEHDFYPIVYHETPNDPSCPLLRRGGSAFYEFCLNRRDGFDGSVTVEAEGLPPGLRCPPIQVGPNVEFSSIVFTAAADAAEWTGAVRLKAWAVIAGKRVEREVGCVQRRGADGNAGNATRACREICLAIRAAEAPYTLQVSDKPLQVLQGATVQTKVLLTRRGDFKDAVRLAAWKPPAGFEVTADEIPAGKGEAVAKITVAAETPPGTYSLILRGDAQVPFSPDPKATEKPNVRVADPAPPLVVVVAAPPKK
jgi:hypothetical protein